MELIAEGEHPLFRPAFLFVTAGTTKGRVKAVFGESLLEALRLHHVCVNLAAVIDRIDALRPPLFVDVHDQIEAQFFGDIFIPHPIHVLEFPGRIDVHQGKRDLGRREGFFSQPQHAGGVFPNRVEHHRVLKLGSDLPDDVDAFGFELFEVGQRVGGHTCFFACGAESGLVCRGAARGRQPESLPRGMGPHRQPQKSAMIARPI